MSYKHKKAFSLIELLVVMAIILIMTAVLFSFDTGKQAQNDVETAGRQVASQLRSLQNDMLNGKQSSAGRYACRAQMTFSNAGASFNISYYDACPTDGSGTGTLLGTSQTVNLKNATFGSDGNIVFASPRGAINKGVGQITIQSGSAVYYICVHGAGSIEENKNIFESALNPTVCP